MCKRGSIFDYWIAMSPNMVALRDLVRDYMANGWEPIGGVAVGEDGVYQALIRRAKVDEE